MPRQIPDRWIPYSACGQVIEGTRIICFKVPLRKDVQKNNKAIKEIWDIQTLINKVPKLGVVIDLTNTLRYYSPKDLETAGIIHKKMLMPGRILPPEDKVKEFMDVVDELLKKDCDYLIGIHCTHGLNRTGYMVCRYMRDRLNIPVDEAINRFQIARGYEIERQNYLNDLLGKTPSPAEIGQFTIIRPCQGVNAIDCKHDEEENLNNYHDEFYKASNSLTSKKRRHSQSDTTKAKSEKTQVPVITGACVFSDLPSDLSWRSKHDEPDLCNFNSFKRCSTRSKRNEQGSYSMNKRSKTLRKRSDSSLDFLDTNRPYDHRYDY